MLKASLLGNMPTRQTVNGTRQFLPLTANVKPLPTLPSIVGDAMYRPERKTESAGSKFFRIKAAEVRNILDTPAVRLAEPTLFNPSRQ